MEHASTKQEPIASLMNEGPLGKLIPTSPLVCTEEAARRFTLNFLRENGPSSARGIHNAVVAKWPELEGMPLSSARTSLMKLVSLGSVGIKKDGDRNIYFAV